MGDSLSHLDDLLIQFNELNSDTEREQGSASNMILAALFCNLKMLLIFPFDVGVHILAP